MKASVDQILAALPHTQCQRCGYPDCAGYAQAIFTGEAPINQCPPGGAEGIARLARITGVPLQPLNPAFGREQERTVAFIDEDWCIGCTLCIKACPVDAIMGSNKHMHTIIESVCTGCELCIPACPVDCIEIEIATPGKTGWDAWSVDDALQADNRYKFHSCSRSDLLVKTAKSHKITSLEKTGDFDTNSYITQPTQPDKKRALIEAAMAKARAKKSNH
jgi:Na+-translocating ferredoxin:NAD+ oxidoreductase subunit B